MADYSKIAEVGNGILELLKEALVPELLNSADQIGLCSPEDHGDFTVGVWLYDLAEDSGLQMHEMIDEGRNSQRYPSVYLILRYAITLYLQSDLKYRAVQEHQILGKIIQTLKDHAALDEKTCMPAEHSSGRTIRFRPGQKQTVSFPVFIEFPAAVFPRAGHIMHPFKGFLLIIQTKVIESFLPARVLRGIISVQIGDPFYHRFFHHNFSARKIQRQTALQGDTLFIHLYDLQTAYHAGTKKKPIDRSALVIEILLLCLKILHG